MNVHTTKQTGPAAGVLPGAPAEGAMTEPERPVVVIEPSRNWVSLDLKGLWQYRDLLYFLTWRDVKVRYKQTLLGGAWAVLQPVLAMAIFTLFFGRLAKMPSDGIPYPLFSYVGVMFWNFFANAVTNSSNSLVGSANLISKVYFPRMIVPAAAVAAGLVDLAVTFVLLGGFLAWYGVVPAASSLLLLPLVLLLIVLSISIGLWMSALNVKYRDIRYALPFLVQIWMFATPVIYPASLVPEKWRWVLALNPVAGVVETARALLFGRPADPVLLGTSIVMTVVLFFQASFIFKRMEKSFADTI